MLLFLTSNHEVTCKLMLCYVSLCYVLHFRVKLNEDQSEIVDFALEGHNVLFVVTLKEKHAQRIFLHPISTIYIMNINLL